MMNIFFFFNFHYIPLLLTLLNHFAPSLARLVSAGRNIFKRGMCNYMNTKLVFYDVQSAVSENERSRKNCATFRHFAYIYTTTPYSRVIQYYKVFSLSYLACFFSGAGLWCCATLLCVYTLKEIPNSNTKSTITLKPIRWIVKYFIAF